MPAPTSVSGFSNFPICVVITPIAIPPFPTAVPPFPKNPLSAKGNPFGPNPNAFKKPVFTFVSCLAICILRGILTVGRVSATTGLSNPNVAKAPALRASMPLKIISGTLANLARAFKAGSSQPLRPAKARPKDATPAVTNAIVFPTPANPPRKFMLLLPKPK